MDIITRHESALLSSPVLALGNFDGVHVGHQRLLHMAVEAAGPDGCPAVLTFEPHPAAILAPGREPPLLTPLPRKLELLGEHGARAVIVEPFTLALAAVPPEEFVEQVLVSSLGVKAVVVGYDFTYGEKRRGTVDTLRRAGQRQGFGVHVVAAVTLDGLAVSSTNVRALLRAGETGEARILLGRPHDVDGQVVRGAGRGREIGFPTANIQVAGGLLPRSGIYAGALTLLDEGKTHAGALSLGRNPTFTPDAPLSLEIHLLDFDGDLYGRRVRVHFHDWIREEARFESVAALLEQMAKDLAMARRMMGAVHT
jgi:riboflavin kinase/FMN adenylyltransferase